MQYVLRGKFESDKKKNLQKRSSVLLPFFIFLFFWLKEVGSSFESSEGGYNHEQDNWKTRRDAHIRRLVSGRQTEEIATVPHKKMARTARTPSKPGVPGGSLEERRDSGRRKLSSQQFVMDNDKRDDCLETKASKKCNSGR